MKSLGRIFELGSNGNKPFKNKYVIVYENKTYFVCKEFGTDYPKTINKKRCIDYSVYMNPNFRPSYWNSFIVDRKHEANIKVDFSEYNLRDKLTEIEKIENRIYNEKQRIKREEEYKKRMEEEQIPKWEEELETLTKSYEKMKEEAKERIEEWNSFAN